MATGIRRFCSALVLGALLGTWQPALGGADDPQTDKDGYGPLFGVPWFIHKGQTNTWGFVDDGTVFTRRGGGGWLMTRKQYADFDLRLEIKMSKGADTGISFRNSLDTDPSFNGNQIQFVDEEISKQWPAIGRTGALWDVAPPQKENVCKPVGEWNQLHIVAKGRQLTMNINGTLILDVNLEKYKERATQKQGGEHVHPDLLREKGHIGLQSWDGLVEFRNLRIKELK